MSGTLTTVNMPTRLDPRFPQQPDFVGRVLREAFSWLLAEVGEHIERRHPDVSPAQIQVMVMIDATGTRPAELARRAQVTRQSMAESLAGLEARGLVSIRPDPHDGRSKLVTVTKGGRAALRDGLDAALAVHRHWESVLGKAKMAQLVALMRELLDGLEAEQAAQTAERPS